MIGGHPGRQVDNETSTYKPDMRNQVLILRKRSYLANGVISCLKYITSSLTPDEYLQKADMQ